MLGPQSKPQLSPNSSSRADTSRCKRSRDTRDTSTFCSSSASAAAAAATEPDFDSDSVSPPGDKRARIGPSANSCHVFTLLATVGSEPQPAPVPAPVPVPAHAGHDVKAALEAEAYGYPPAGPQQFDWLGYQRAMQQRMPTAHGSKHFWHPEDPCSQQYYATAFDVGLALHQLESDPNRTEEEQLRRDVLASIERYLHSPQYEATSTWRIAPIDDTHVLALLTAAADQQVNAASDVAAASATAAGATGGGEHKARTSRWFWLRVIGTMHRPSSSRGHSRGLSSPITKPLPMYAQLVADQQPFRRAEAAEMLVQFALGRLLKRPLDDVLYPHHRAATGSDHRASVSAFWQPFTNADMDDARRCLQVSGPIAATESRQQSSSSSSSSSSASRSSAAASVSAHNSSNSFSSSSSAHCTSPQASNLEAYVVQFDPFATRARN